MKLASCFFALFIVSGLSAHHVHYVWDKSFFEVWLGAVSVASLIATILTGVRAAP